MTGWNLPDGCSDADLPGADDDDEERARLRDEARIDQAEQDAIYGTDR